MGILENKTSVITGARRGIGRATVEVFAREGSDIFACARKYDEAFENDMKAVAEKCGVNVFPIYFDVSNEEQVKNATKEMRKLCSKVDILANVAGIVAESKSFTMMPLEKMEEVFKVNFWGITLVTQYITRLMIRNHSGSIINVSSMAGIDGMPAQYEYAASKGAVIGGVKQLARELWQYGIRVNAVAPGITNTDMGGQVDTVLYEEVMARVVMKRVGSPEEIANVIAFLGSDMSSYMTGQIIRVDGGA